MPPHTPPEFHQFMMSQMYGGFMPNFERYFFPAQQAGLICNANGNPGGQGLPPHAPHGPDQLTALEQIMSGMSLNNKNF